jgi:hypothetical protein
MSFALDLTAIVKKAQDKADLVVRKTVFELGNKLVYRTPVGDATLWKSAPPPGYVGGRARANWQHGFGSAPSESLADIDPAGNATRSKVEASINKGPAFGIHYLVNNLPYAWKLERGHSTQAPQGMVGLAVADFENVVKEAAR